MTKVGAKKGFLDSLSRAPRVYVLVAVSAALLVFIGVEGWRVLVWLFTPGAAAMPGDGQSGYDTPAAILYVAASGSYVVCEYVGHRPLAAAYVLLGVLYVMGGTVSIYGLLAVVAGLIPNLPQYDLFEVTLVSMSILLGAYSLFHRRINH